MHRDELKGRYRQWRAVTGTVANAVRHARWTALERREQVFLLALFFLAAAALLGYCFGPVPLSYMITFATMPVACLATVLTLWRRGQLQPLHRFLGRLLRGALCGLAATLCYDVYRPVIKSLLGFQFVAFRVMPIFGNIITGLPSTAAGSLIVGWIYHLWIGVLLGMMLSLLRPRGGAFVGLLWATVIQTVRLAAYPIVLQASLQDPEFLATGVIGYALWGLLLGAALRRLADRAPRPAPNAGKTKSKGK